MAAGTFFVLDEAFIDFCEAESAKHIAAKTPNMLLLRSLTKFYALPGLRLGWGVATSETIARLSELKGPWSVGSIAQTAALASLADHEYAERSIRLITEWRTELMEQLNNLQGCTAFQSAANFILLKLPSATADQVAATLLRHRILIRNCANFIGLDGHFIRMAVRTGGENRLLLDALNLKTVVK
jgi:threonine-phosphate decarboxylase